MAHKQNRRMKQNIEKAVTRIIKFVMGVIIPFKKCKVVIIYLYFLKGEIITKFEVSCY